MSTGKYFNVLSMPKPFTDKKFNLREPLATQLVDFCAANYKAPAIEVIREAVREHIERRLKNPEMKERYEEARKKRLGLAEKIVQLVDNKE